MSSCFCECPLCQGSVPPREDLAVIRLPELWEPLSALSLLPRRPRGWLEEFDAGPWREDWLCLRLVPCSLWHLMLPAPGEFLDALRLPEVCVLLSAPGAGVRLPLTVAEAAVRLPLTVPEAALRLLPGFLLSWLGELEARSFSGERLLVRPVSCCPDCLLRSAAGQFLEDPTSRWRVDPRGRLSAPGAGVGLLRWCPWGCLDVCPRF